MNKLNRRNLSSGRVALIISVVALVFALVGTAFSGGSAVPGKNGVKTSDIAKAAVKEGKLAGGAVTEAKIGAGAVTSEKVFLSGMTTQNLPPITAETCTSFPVPAGGISATDHVLVTPPPGFADTFTLTGKPEPSTNTVVFALCNTFTAGAGDPDGVGGGPYKFLVIR